ncbi:MAG: glycine cleavage system protein R [Gammaproteobacteria bacterium]|nr:glycine cleavage system protein R [Gammaproteobacteria bacterium]
MKTEKLVITIFAEDRPGIMQIISDTVLEHGGNWLESSLNRLSGQFAGIVNIEVAEDQISALSASFEKLVDDGIKISTFKKLDEPRADEFGERVELLVEANDRPGIVEEIASALASAGINAEKMETAYQSASMAGYQLFSAHLTVALPQAVGVEKLEAVLEQVSDDLMVSIIDAD